MNNQTLEEIQIISDARNLAGYDIGMQYRQQYFIDVFDIGNPIIVNISDDIFHISSSFILGMFEDSKKHFQTLDDFFNHYNFNCNQTLFLCVLNGVKRIYPVKNIGMEGERLLKQMVVHGEFNNQEKPRPEGRGQSPQ